MLKRVIICGREVEYNDTEFEVLETLMIDPVNPDYVSEQEQPESKDALKDRINTYLIEGKPEKEVCQLLKDGDIPIENIISALYEVNPSSSVVAYFVTNKMVPYVEELLLEVGKKVTVGEARRVLCNKYPENLVNRAMWLVLDNHYLID